MICRLAHPHKWLTNPISMKKSTIDIKLNWRLYALKLRNWEGPNPALSSTNTDTTLPPAMPPVTTVLANPSKSELSYDSQAATLSFFKPSVRTIGFCNFNPRKRGRSLHTPSFHSVCKHCEASSICPVVSSVYLVYLYTAWPSRKSSICCVQWLTRRIKNLRTTPRIH